MIRRRGAKAVGDARSSVIEPDLAAEGFEISPLLARAIHPLDPAGRAVHELANEVVQNHFGLGCRGLAICGASQGTGVSFTAACVAAALARSGAPTLLLEANLRSPSLEQMIRPSVPTRGLLQFLRSEAESGDIVHNDVLPDLAIVYAGGIAPDADELFASSRFRKLLSDCLRDFTCVVVDTAPANRYADARTVAVAVGYAAIVGRRQYSFVNDVSLLARQLNEAGVKVIGAIFNSA